MSVGYALTGARRSFVRAAVVALAMLALPRAALAGDASAWLTRAATAARQLNYVGTIVYQHGAYSETSRLVHLYDLGEEFDKLVNLDGPAREVIRSHGEVRCFYPDAKVVRVEPRTFRNAFPSVSPQQQKALAEFYEFRKAETARVAGLETQAWVFEPKDGLRYGHKFWTDIATGLIVKARVVDERNGVLEQFAFSEVAIGAKIDRDMVKPTYPPTPSGWRVRRSGQAEADSKDTGWTATRIPPGFVKIVDGFRRVQGTRQVAHLVYSDGLVAVSVFVEPGGGAPHPGGFSAQNGLNVFSRQVDENVVTVLGQVPAVTLRQIANSVARR
ncbi:MAG: MucB/RseB C-terminal domain-containing protein [Betaproteobacteria bacterium]